MHTRTESFRNQPVPKPGTIEVKAVRFMRLPEVRDIAGLSRSQLYRLEAVGRFPKRIKLGNGPTGASAWIESEVLGWCSDRIAASREAAA